MSRRSCLNRVREAAPAVLPSLLMCDFGNLEREVNRLQAAGVQALHLDVMDGQFVPNLTYGMPVVAALRRLTEMPLDVHLMVDRPERFLREFREAGADLITVHIEALSDPRGTLTAIRDLDMAGGLAINPATSIESVIPFLDVCDLVLVMSVPAGFGGQKFDSTALTRLRRLRQEGPPDLLLEVDGGVNTDTIGACAEAGAQLFVVGSAIFRQADYGVAMRELTERARAGMR